MSRHDTSYDPSVADQASESSLADRGPDGEISDTIELAFSGTEFNEFLSDAGMSGDLSDWLTQKADPAVRTDPLSTADSEPRDQAASVDGLLAALGDDMRGSEGEDMLETAARLGKPMAGEDDRTFLLTEVAIGDLIGDYGQAGDPGLEVEYLDPSSAQSLVLDLGEPGPVVIEIEDDAGILAVHI